MADAGGALPQPPAAHYAIALGANRGERAATFAQALADLAQAGIAVVACSRWHETAPCGGPPGQEQFLNGAAVVRTGLGPHQLLALLQRIEIAHGRTRAVRHGPRTLDLDLLLRADQFTCATPVLTLPHPRLHERAFVLLPLAEIAAAWRIPGRGTVGELARASAARQGR